MHPRPTGHIAANLDVLAIAMHRRITHSTVRDIHVAWVNDDGCVFMATDGSAAAKAVTVHAPDQVFQRYRKAPGLGRPEILEDLAEARLAYARRSLQAAEVSSP